MEERGQGASFIFYLSFLFPSQTPSLQGGKGGVSAQGIGQSPSSLGGNVVVTKAVEEIYYDIMRGGET